MYSTRERAPLVLGGRRGSLHWHEARGTKYRGSRYRAVRAGRGGRSRGRCLGDWRAVALQPEARTHPASPLPTFAYCALQMLPFVDRGHSQKPPESSPDDRPSIFIGSLCKSHNKSERLFSNLITYIFQIRRVSEATTNSITIIRFRDIFQTYKNSSRKCVEMC